LVDLGARLRDHLLDPRRVDPAIDEQTLEGALRDLAADRIESRDDDGFRRVVDDQVDAREGLERSDVATLAADDPALPVIREGGVVRAGRAVAILDLGGPLVELLVLLVEAALVALELRATLAVLQLGGFGHLEGLVLGLEDDLLLLRTGLGDEPLGIRPGLRLTTERELATGDDSDHDADDETRDEGQKAHDSWVGHDSGPFRVAYARALARMRRSPPFFAQVTSGPGRSTGHVGSQSFGDIRIPQGDAARTERVHGTLGEWPSRRANGTLTKPRSGR